MCAVCNILLKSCYIIIWKGRHFIVIWCINCKSAVYDILYFKSVYWILWIFFLLFKRSVTRIKSIYQMKYLYVSVINSKLYHCMDKYVLISYVLKMQFNYRYKYFLLWRRNKAYLYLWSKFSTHSSLLYTTRYQQIME